MEPGNPWVQGGSWRARVWDTHRGGRRPMALFPVREISHRCQTERGALLDAWQGLSEGRRPSRRAAVLRAEQLTQELAAGLSAALGPTLEDLVSQETRRPVSRRTLEETGRILREWAELLGPGRAAGLVTTDEIEGYVTRLRARGVSWATVRNHLQKISAAYRRSQRRVGGVSANPCEAVELPSEGPRRAPVALSPSEWGPVLEAAGEPLRGFLVVALETGARQGELRLARWKDWDREGHTLEVNGKTGRRRVPLTPRAEEVLSEIRRGASPHLSWIFPKLRSRSTVHAQFKRAVEQSGLGRPLRFHDLRHSAVTHWATLGLTEEERRELAGHATTRMTQSYTHGGLERAVARLRAAPETPSPGTAPRTLPRASPGS